MSEHSSEIRKICALGAGTMGVGTAVDYAKEGYQVALYVREDAAKDELFNERKRHKVAEETAAVLKDMADHHLIDEESIPSIIVRIKITSDLHEAAADADVVMESIAENVPAKQDIFSRLDKICPPHTIFATNTSALNPTEIASVLSEQRRTQFIVLHGFNPPHLIPLVEVAPGAETSHETIYTATHLLQNIGKRPALLHKATPGFIGNYIQSAIIWAALKLHVEFKRPAAEIDREFKEHLGQYYEALAPFEMDGLTVGELSDIEASAALAILNEKAPDTTTAGWIRDAALRASLELVANGTASAREVENAFVHSLGRRYRETGPLESADLGGLDIFQSIFNTVGYLKAPTPIGNWLAQRVEEGKVGTKSQTMEGIYAWTPETAAEVKGRRKAKLIDLLRQDQTTRPAGPAVRPDFTRHASVS